MIRGLYNKNARLHKELGFLTVIIALFVGCIEIPAEKNWDCTHPDNEGKWDCTSLNTNRVIHCFDEVYKIQEDTGIDTDPTCIPEWCDLPIQDCSLPPLTGGKDSCGNPCSKPSEQWKNCIQ